ncbi:UvrABC system protein C [Streptomyces violaceorubidus]
MGGEAPTDGDRQATGGGAADDGAALTDGQEVTDGPALKDDDGRPKRFAYPPQLVVVDGGQPQVAAAERVLDELGIDDIAVCGLAKRLEEVWLPRDDDPVVLPRTARASTCCSGSATRPTASRSPTSAPSAPSASAPVRWTTCPAWGRPANRR